MSKNGNNQPFAKNNEFLKTFQHYKHYKDWLNIIMSSTTFYSKTNKNNDDFEGRKIDYNYVKI